jgi:putative endonuclease
MMFYVYVLRNSQGKYYIGVSSKEPNVRAIEHAQNKSHWTKDKGPWEVVCSEEFPDKASAWRRERRIKSYKGGDAFKRLLLEGCRSGLTGTPGKRKSVEMRTQGSNPCPSAIIFAKQKY